MINIDSKSALSMMKFDMEIAKTKCFDVTKQYWRLSCVKGKMEGVLLKVRCPIIADFYKKRVAKWKTFSICHFKKMECKKNVIFHVMQLVDAGESFTRKESHLS